MFGQSLHHAVKRLRHDPGFSIAAALTLALGVGANVAVFAVVEAVLLRPLPYAQAGDLAIVRHIDQRTGITKEFIALGDYVDLAERQSAFDAFVGYGTFQTTLYQEGESFQASGLAAAPGLFDAFRLRPLLGRGLEADDSRQGAAPVAVLGHRLWQERYGGDPEIVGRSIRIGDDVTTIVGVAPESFHFPPNADTDLILPWTVPAAAPANRKSGWIFAVARLRDGQTFESATADLASVSTQMESEYPEQNQGSSYYAIPLREALVGSTQQALVLLLAAVGFVLLIACANVANLQMARSLARRREIAVRMALGSDRSRLIAMFLAESMVLALCAGVIGIGIANVGVRALVALVPESVTVPGLADIRLNGIVLGFALTLVVAAAVVFGVVAALAVRLEHVGDTLVTAGRASAGRMMRRAMSGLVVAEVALAVVLLIGAGLVLRSFAGLLAVDPGFDYTNVLTAEIQLPGDRYQAIEARQAFWTRALDEMQAIPGVEAVGMAVVVPLTGNNWTVPFEREDAPVPAGQRAPDVGWQSASGGFFHALDIPLLSGRYFDDRERPGGSPAVIISESIEKEFFPTESAVGKRVRLGQNSAEIVGVVGDIRRAALDDRPRADMYFPFESNPGGQVTLFVRTSGDATRAMPPLRAALTSIEPATAFLTTRTLDDVASESVRVRELVLWLLGVFSIVALTLAAIGIYGVMSYAVRQRTREIGTRLAVGATAQDIVWLVVRHGAIVAAIGIGAGLIVGLVATRSLRSILYGVTTSDPVTLAAAASALALTVIMACYIPARRAAGIDPVRSFNS